MGIRSATFDYAGFFRGTVSGPDGRPLAGARVYNVPFEGDRTDPGPVRATTAADGRFEFHAPDMTYPRYDSPDYLAGTDRRKVVAYPQPGTAYFLAKAVVEKGADVVFEGVRGVPLRSCW